MSLLPRAPGQAAFLAGLIAPLMFTQAFAAFVAPDAPFALPGAPWLLATAALIVAALIAERQTRLPAQ